MDRRLTPFNGRVAHVSLRGQVDAEEFVEGSRETVVWDAVPLFDGINLVTRKMDRQLHLGETVTVVEFGRGHAFVVAEKDGYVGYIRPMEVSDANLPKATHRVCSRATHAYSKPDFKQTWRARPLSMGCLLHVISEEGRFAKVTMPLAPDAARAYGDDWEPFYIPATHLRALDDPEADRAAVAERFLGTPYLWGGNSARGIDCSGLIQEALLACAIPCPGDSDMQEAELGKTLPPNTPAQRGDLFFWKGHVAMAVDSDTLIHANAFHMAVAYEPINEAIARIQAQGDGPVTRHARLT